MGAIKQNSIATASPDPPRTVGSNDFVFKTKPFEHQLKIFNESRDAEEFAIFWEQGTGKTKLILDTAAWLWERGRIDGMLIVAPNGVHSNWINREIPIHLPERVPAVCFNWTGTTSKKSQRQMATTASAEFGVFAINVEAFSSPRGAKAAREFLMSGRRLMIVDESTRIKTPGAKRTKAIIRLSSLAPFRRILTGTPITQSPLDLYAQMLFLNPAILGFSSYYAFKHYYAVWEQKIDGNSGHKYERIVQFVHLDELIATLEPVSSRITKSECLDLPDKIYKTRPVVLSKEQRALYKSMSEQLMLEIEGEQILATITLTKILRLRQITGGFVPVENGNKSAVPIPGTNPKIDALLETIEESAGEKMIVWAVFRAEIQKIGQILKKEFGQSSVMEYHGGVSRSDRNKSIDLFQSDPNVRFFVGTPQSGGMGLTLTAAETVVYFSTDWKLEDRLQSEDRNHRIGQRKNVLYVDLIADDTIDVDVVESLRRKKSLADYITRDRVRAMLAGRGVTGEP